MVPAPSWILDMKASWRAGTNWNQSRECTNEPSCSSQDGGSCCLSNLRPTFRYSLGYDGSKPCEMA